MQVNQETIGNWRDFWSAPLAHEFQTEESWQMNARLFVERSHAILDYRPDDVLLDVGSGPGITADILRKRVAEVHCAEVSRTFVEAARKRLGDCPNVVLHELGPDYTDLSFLEPKQFSLFLCNNVV